MASGGRAQRGAGPARARVAVASGKFHRLREEGWGLGRLRPERAAAARRGGTPGDAAMRGGTRSAPGAPRNGVTDPTRCHVRQARTPPNRHMRGCRTHPNRRAPPGTCRAPRQHRAQQQPCAFVISNCSNARGSWQEGLVGRRPPKCPTWDAAALGVQHQCPKANTLTPNPLSVKSLPPPGMLNDPTAPG